MVGGFFFQFTGSMCGNMTNLILGIYIFFYFEKENNYCFHFLSREIVSLIPRLKEKEPPHEDGMLSSI